MAKASSKKPVIPSPVAGGMDAASLNPSVTEAPAKAGAKSIQVVALAKGTYDGVRRKEGDKFTVSTKTIEVDGKKKTYTAEEQIGSWMKKI